MVADIKILQGKIIDDPEQRTKNISRLIEELALEILTDEELALAIAPQVPQAQKKAEGNA